MKDIFDQRQKLLGQIVVDRKRWHKIDEPLVFSMFNVSDEIERSSINISGNFLHNQLLIDLLLRLKSTEANKKEFLALCRETYKDKPSILRMIDEFEEEYSEEYALWWYTRDTFLFRELNKALRFQNIDWLFQFRFFIHDMHKLLKQLHEEQQQAVLSSKVFYRGQLIAFRELTRLKDSIGGLISFNSFLSTSDNRQYTLFLLDGDQSASETLRPILFEIKSDNQIKSETKVFANISGMSAFAGDEQETLFMIGSVFRLESTFEEGCITVFKMTLCSDNDHDLTMLFEQMKNEIGIGKDDTLLTLGTLLWRSGRFDQAEQFYRRMLNEIPAEDHLVQNCYQGLGFVAAAKGDLDTSLMWQTKVLEYYQRTLPIDYYSLGCTWNSIGNIHWRAQKYKLALESYSQAKPIFEKHHDRDLGSCLNNMGNVCEEMKQYEEALQYHTKALQIREGILPPSHSELGTSHHNIANVYRQLGQLNLARVHAKCALNIFQKSLRANDPSIATAYQTIGAIELDCGAYRKGLRHLEQAAAIFRETLPSNHPTVENIHLTILKVVKAMSEYGMEFI